ncbi:hypothetical protein BBJ28_00018380 [Nothophytophthora sp. Chile5]|nr:hypothetical protein BBJ28_00018380 [Nothophytophthora sp. Chile5]
MASAMRSNAARAVARQLSRQAAPLATHLRLSALPQKLSTQTRSMGVFSNLKDTMTHKLEERSQAKQEDAYKQQMIDLAYADKFDLNAFYVQLKVRFLSPLALRSPYFRIQCGAKQLFADPDGFLYLFQPEFRENPRLINGKVKRKISEKSGHVRLSSPEEINTMLRNYEQLSALHIWLVKRVERGLSIPETMDETTELVRLDPTGFPAKKFRYVGSRRRRRRRPIAMQSSHRVVFGDPQKPVKLDDFRNVLIRSKSAAFGGLKGKYNMFDGSLLDFMLLETEKLHALTRRYTSPDENAFFLHLLPEPILPIIDYPRVLNPNRININDQIMSVYQDKILPGITTASSDDSSYGSTATADIAVLQALSKRIHFGKFIAEAKFQAETERYTQLILANDAAGIMDALTNLAVEQKVLDRVKLKASTYGQDPNAPAAASPDKEWKVNPQLISDLYRDFVMPLTKEVQVAYLLQRVSHPSISVAGVEGSFCWLAAQAHFGGEMLQKDQFLQAESVSKVFHDVNANRTAFGVVPIEDSRLGMLKETQAQLLRSSLKVSAEIVLTRSFIFAAKDKRLEKSSDVTQVFCPTDTDARMLAHAEQSWPSAQMVSVANVSEAASRASKEAGTVAVTTSVAALAHGLDHVETSNALASASAALKAPADGGSSFIRFVVVSKGCPAATGKDKSCLSMEIKHEVGSLLSALEVWKCHGINLTCLESIYRQEQGGYDFFVEIVGHFDDDNVREAVEKLQSQVCEVKHLGSFPIAKLPILS